MKHNPVFVVVVLMLILMCVPGFQRGAEADTAAGVPAAEAAGPDLQSVLEDELRVLVDLAALLRLDQDEHALKLLEAMIDQATMHLGGSDASSSTTDALQRVKVYRGVYPPKGRNKSEIQQILMEVPEANPAEVASDPLRLLAGDGERIQ